MCYSPWGRKESDTTGGLNYNNQIENEIFLIKLKRVLRSNFVKRKKKPQMILKGKQVNWF